ncbi:hypothetical protein AURDEDRAFT_60516 [Auricularia subglabra TFB-10046 SS5]|nr:hypothetical protein AURDEDRAFT_60516 [Auricularia subglabra TFB-10046 SS5]
MAPLFKQDAESGLYNLNEGEQFWADVQPYLLSKGYCLRPRYTPGWKPVWIHTDIDPRWFEDAVKLPLPSVIDAQRVSDGTVVAIKWIPDAEHTRDELDVMRFLSTGDLRNDPQNHCNPLLDSFSHPSIPEGVFIVTPWLAGFDYVPLERVGEVVELLKQLIECLSFMHRNGIAHRDCTGLNIMQDIRDCFNGRRTHPIQACYSEDIQTIYDRDPEAMPKFYFIDFGVSSRHEGPGPHLVTGIICRDRTPPELSRTVPYDPFKLDIYLLGNHVLQKYLGRYSNLEFLRPVLLAMTNANPASRPTADESLVLLNQALQHVLGVQLRWRLRERDETLLNVVFDDGGHLLREVGSHLRSFFS